MLKNLPIIPSRTSQKILILPIVLTLFPNHQLLFLIILLILLSQ